MTLWAGVVGNRGKAGCGRGGAGRMGVEQGWGMGGGKGRFLGTRFLKDLPSLD